MVGPAQSSQAGVYVAKFHPEASTLAYSTYVGDGQVRTAFGTDIDVDPTGSAYVAQTAGAGGETGQLDVVLTKLDASGDSFEIR